MLDRRRRRGADIVEMLYSCFVFTVICMYLEKRNQPRYLEEPFNLSNLYFCIGLPQGPES